MQLGAAVHRNPQIRVMATVTAMETAVVAMAVTGTLPK
jgi:hypothetical protein